MGRVSEQDLWMFVQLGVEQGGGQAVSSPCSANNCFVDATVDMDSVNKRSRTECVVPA